MTQSKSTHSRSFNLSALGLGIFFLLSVIANYQLSDAGISNNELTLPTEQTPNFLFRSLDAIYKSFRLLILEGPEDLITMNVNSFWIYCLHICRFTLPMFAAAWLVTLVERVFFPILMCVRYVQARCFSEMEMVLFVSEATDIEQTEKLIEGIASRNTNVFFTILASDSESYFQWARNSSAKQVIWQTAADYVPFSDRKKCVEREYFLCRSDQENLGILKALRKVAANEANTAAHQEANNQHKPNETSEKDIQVFVFISNYELYKQLISNESKLAQDSHNFDVEFINLDENNFRVAFTDPKFAEAVVRSADNQVTLFVYGDDSNLEALIDKLSEIAVVPNITKYKLVYADKLSGNMLERLKQKYKNLFTKVEIYDLTDRSVSTLRQAYQDTPDIDVHLFLKFQSEDTPVFLEALQAAETTNEKHAAIVIAENTNDFSKFNEFSEAAEKYTNNLITLNSINLVNFDSKGNYEQHAKAVNDIYMKSQPDEGQAWSQLSQQERYSNKRCGDHLRFLAAYLDAKCKYAAKSEASNLCSAEFIQQLSAAEHNSWCNEKLLNGWKLSEAGEKDPRLKLHRALLPYANLPLDEQSKDTKMIDHCFSLCSSEIIKKLRANEALKKQ